VFRLRDGRAIRMPVDTVPGHPENAYEKYVENLTQRIGRKFPELTSGESGNYSRLQKDGPTPVPWS